MSQSQGRPLRLSHADIASWHEHVVPTATCHVWMGAVGSDGYGRFQISNKYDGIRMLTLHQATARLGFGPRSRFAWWTHAKTREPAGQVIASGFRRALHAVVQSVWLGGCTASGLRSSQMKTACRDMTSGE